MHVTLWQWRALTNPTDTKACLTWCIFPPAENPERNYLGSLRRDQQLKQFPSTIHRGPREKGENYEHSAQSADSKTCEHGKLRLFPKMTMRFLVEMVHRTKQK